jgi:hypothetical protein
MHFENGHWQVTHPRRIFISALLIRLTGAFFSDARCPRAYRRHRRSRLM